MLCYNEQYFDMLGVQRRMNDLPSAKCREWTVLFVGGASGTGKSSIAHALSRCYGVNVLEIDDIVQALKAMTTGATLPALHYWRAGGNWMDAGVPRNVQWLIDVSREMASGLRSIVEDHLETDVPVIIEGDFMEPAFMASFGDPRVRSFFVHEPDREQIVRNYLAREGGDAQGFRAEVSAAYGEWIAGECERLGIRLVEARPWETLLERVAGGM